MIDLHAHVLPGLDDGPRTLAEAIALVDAARDVGTKTIVATPHVNVRYRVHAHQIALATGALNDALRRARVAVTVLPGAEIALERLIDLDAADLDRLGLGGGSCLLVEPPLRRLAGDFEWPIRKLLEDPGRRVLLAHAERCPTFRHEPRRLYRLIEAGALVQVTVGSLTGRFGVAIREFALLLVRCGLVHNLASDMHEPGLRGPSLRDGLAVLADRAGVAAAQAEWLTVGMPCAIVGGGALPPTP